MTTQILPLSIIEKETSGFISASNRHQDAVYQSDISLVQSYLDLHKDNNGYNSYYSGLQFLYLFCFYHLEISLFDLNETQIDSFNEFLKTPPPSWTGKKTTAKINTLDDFEKYQWKPFTVGLSDNRIKVFNTICKSFFKWGVENEHFINNPFQTDSKKTRKPDKTSLSERNLILILLPSLYSKNDNADAKSFTYHKFLTALTVDLDITESQIKDKTMSAFTQCIDQPKAWLIQLNNINRVLNPITTQLLEEYRSRCGFKMPGSDDSQLIFDDEKPLIMIKNKMLAALKAHFKDDLCQPNLLK
ncbi:MAG: hypothetical protein HON94_10630 [Methylococcales bacterium]|jgi:hypothetical protein|nr:hypothetical protein [Methylococcales bacterium]MBT7409220.1 hypothetical protein [Methylococcales bacterium]